MSGAVNGVLLKLSEGLERELAVRACSKQTIRSTMSVRCRHLPVMISIIIIACALSGCQGLTAAKEARPRPVDDLRASLPKIAGISCNAPVLLEDLRFLFQIGCRFYVELSCDTADWNSFPQELPFGFGVELTPEQQAWSLQRTGVKIGDTYTCLDMVHAKTFNAHLQGIAGCHEGGNGDRGILGMLDFSSSDSVEIQGPWAEQVVGVAFPAVPSISFVYKTVDPLSEREKKTVQKTLRAQFRDETIKVLEAVKNPGDGGVLAVAEYMRRVRRGEVTPGKSSFSIVHEPATSVFYLLPARSGYQALSFNLGLVEDDIDGKGFLFGYYPSAPKGNRFFWLPDLDHDGYSELLISCREGFVFRVLYDGAPAGRGKRSSEEVRNFHFGMRE